LLFVTWAAAAFAAVGESRDTAALTEARSSHGLAPMTQPRSTSRLAVLVLAGFVPAFWMVRRERRPSSANR